MRNAEASNVPNLLQTYCKMISKTLPWGNDVKSICCLTNLKPWFCFCCNCIEIIDLPLPLNFYKKLKKEKMVIESCTSNIDTCHNWSKMVFDRT